MAADSDVSSLPIVFLPFQQYDPMRKNEDRSDNNVFPRSPRRRCLRSRTSPPRPNGKGAVSRELASCGSTSLMMRLATFLNNIRH